MWCAALFTFHFWHILHLQLLLLLLRRHLLLQVNFTYSPPVVELVCGGWASTYARTADGQVFALRGCEHKALVSEPGRSVRLDGSNRIDLPEAADSVEVGWDGTVVALTGVKLAIMFLGGALFADKDFDVCLAGTGLVVWRDDDSTSTPALRSLSEAELTDSVATAGAEMDGNILVAGAHAGLWRWHCSTNQLPPAEADSRGKSSPDTSEKPTAKRRRVQVDGKQNATLAAGSRLTQIPIGSERRVVSISCGRGHTAILVDGCGGPSL